MASVSVNQHITNFTYRFRPEQPKAESAYLSIAANARRPFFSKGEPLNVVVWNTYKGKRERYYDVLAEHGSNADLILLQEFRHDPLLESAHGSLFAERDAGLAISFYTRPSQSSPTGVCTVSSVRSTDTQLVLSRYFEPVTRTPKMAICTCYPIDCDDCAPEQTLLVFNSHGINFRLRKPFLDQMHQFEEHLRHHKGPIILVGDFNTWERGRVRILESITHRIGLQRIAFPTGIKSVRGHELDRVYVRGGVAQEQRVVTNAAASDHSMLAFQFVLDSQKP